jgi:hypothetical protein
MPVLRSIESKIESLFEGVFGRAFRTHVQPIELARKLAKEMDDHRNVSVSRVYVPNEYTVYLAPPSVLVTTDDDLAVGEFGIATRLVATENAGEASPPVELPVAEPAQTMIYKAPVPATPDEPPVEPRREVVTLTVAGRKHEITKPSIVLGRSREADLRIADVNVSRRHAEIRQEGTTYWVVDLDSTNGLEVNGKRTERSRLRDGDRITMGSTEVVFGRGVPDSG